MEKIKVDLCTIGFLLEVYFTAVADEVGVLENNNGVVYSILSLQAEVQATDALNEIFKALEPFVNLRPNDDSKLIGPDFELANIESALAFRPYRKNKFEKLFEEMTAALDQEMLKVGQTTLSLALDPKEIALSLQVIFFYDFFRKAF